MSKNENLFQLLTAYEAAAQTCPAGQQQNESIFSEFKLGHKIIHIHQVLLNCTVQQLLLKVEPYKQSDPG